MFQGRKLFAPFAQEMAHDPIATDHPRTAAPRKFVTHLLTCATNDGPNRPRCNAAALGLRR